MPLVVTGILLNCFCFLQQGDWSRFAYPVQRSYGISVDEWSDQPLVPAQFLTFGKGLMHSADMSERRQPARPAIVDGFSSFWALLPLEDLQDPVVRTLRKWNPRPACGTAIKSRISMSV